MGGGTADDTPSRHFGKRWTNAETIHGTLGSTATLQLPRNCRSASSCAAHYLQARNHHFEAVVNAGRKSDAESDAATAQNRAQQAPARRRKESQDGMETGRSSRVITVLPNKTEVVYKRTVGPVGLEPTTKGL